MDAVLEARDVTKHYEDFSLSGISVEVRPGCVVGVFGPNGAGKSTILRILANQVPADGGTVRVFGLGFGEREAEIKNRVGYVAQEPSYYAGKTVQWTARFAARYFERWDGACFYRLLDGFRVNHLKKIEHLSGGQKKLLSLAFALSHEADLLVLDEPTAGLDAVHRRALLDRLRVFVADGQRAVLVASHVTDALDEIADEVFFVHEGRVVLRDAKDDLLSRWKWIHYKEGVLAPALEDRLRNVSRQPYASRGLTSDFPALRESLADPVAAGDAKVENARLEDVLVSIVKGA